MTELWIVDRVMMSESAGSDGPWWGIEIFARDSGGKMLFICGTRMAASEEPLLTLLAERAFIELYKSNQLLMRLTHAMKVIE